MQNHSLHFFSLFQLSELSDLLDPRPNLSDCDPDQARAFEALRQELSTARNRASTEMGREWDARVALREDKPEDGGEARTVTVKLSLSEERGDLARALAAADLLDYRMGRFAARFLSSVLRPIVRQAVVVEQQSDQEGHVVSLQLRREVRKMPIKL